MSDELINYWPKYEYNPKDWKAEVERLTAELAAEKIHAVEATNVIIEAQAREKKLRAIPSHIEARDNPYIGTAQGVAVACDWFRQMMEEVT